MCKREGKKIRIRYANITVVYICFSRQRFGSGPPSHWRFVNLFDIFVKSVGWLRSVTPKVSHRDRFRDHRNFQAEQDTPPSLSSAIKATIGRRHRMIERTHLLGCIGDDAGNGHSMLIWKIRCGGGSLSPKAKVEEKMADGRNAGYMLTKIFRNSVSDPEPVGP